MDSLLVVNQVNGGYCAWNESMAAYLAVVNKKKAYFCELRLFHILRGENKHADALAYVAALVGSEKRTIDVGYIEQPATAIQTVNAIHVQPVADSWITPIYNFLVMGTLPGDKIEARSLREKAKRYTTLNGKLYRRSSKGGVLLRCVTDVEALNIMSIIDDGYYGNHACGKSLAHKIWTQGYYWRKMQEAAKEYVQKCHKCQIHAHDIHAPAGDLHNVETPWPFAVWGMDVVGPLPATVKDGHGGVRFMLAVTDYFTKWVEVVALTEVKHQNVIKFIK